MGIEEMFRDLKLGGYNLEVTIEDIVALFFFSSIWLRWFYMQNLSRRLYLNKLPKKRMGAGCLLFDNQGRILILKPTYKDHWLLPGGVIEANQSPRQACIREVKEETGIDCQPTKLICIDYVSDRQLNF
jgi:8-oxo-dGTP pyrophosphatase MutT (NUDIX family)